MALKTDDKEKDVYELLGLDDESLAQAKTIRKKQQLAKASLKYRRKNPGGMRKYYVYRRYNITPEAYDKLVEDQDGRCAICKTDKLRNGDANLHLDHDHATKMVRGLLCTTCNLGLGHFKDDIAFIESALEYLKKWC